MGFLRVRPVRRCGRTSAAVQLVEKASRSGPRLCRVVGVGGVHDDVVVRGSSENSAARWREGLEGPLQRVGARF